MKVSFSPSVNISFDSALSAAKAAYPEVDFTGIRDSEGLYKKLADSELVLFVDIDPQDEFDSILKEEADLASDIDAGLDECHDPDLPQVIFDDSEIPDDPFCVPEDLEDFTVPEASLEDLAAELQKIQADMDGGLSEGKSLDDLSPDSKIGAAVKCIREMEKITAEMKVLLDRENKIRKTRTNFEQLLYNYRIMEKYYQQKIDTLNSILGTFQPLLERKREIENELIPQKNQQLAQRRQDLANYISTIRPGTPRPTTEETAINNDIIRIQSEFTGLVQDLGQVNNNIILEKNNIYSFDFELLQNNDIALRRSFLQAQLSSLFGGGVDSAAARTSQFSTRVELRPTSSGNGDDVSFRLSIQHELVDGAGILLGRDLSFVRNDDFITIENYKPGEPGGVLYTQLYNIWGDVDRFFTREERGLTDDANYQDSSLKNTGVGPVNGNYIKNLTAYEEFYTKFAEKHEAKANLVKETVIEPSLSTVQQDMIFFATREVQLLLSFGKAFEDLPAESGIIQNVIKSVYDAAGVYINKLRACRATYDYIVDQHNKALQDIQNKQKEYTGVSCAGGERSPGNPPPPGSDPLGNNMGQEDPSNPNPTKWCYWLKFAALATSVNLLPLPGPLGFKYWPIGYVISTPTGLVKIPLPIVWIPIAAISLPIGTFVIFIGQCGICPSPFVFYSGVDGEKKFIVSLRPTLPFGTDSSDGIFKTIDKGGIAVRKKMVDLVNDIKVKLPNGTLGVPPGFNSVRSDSKSTVLNDLKENILRKVNKIGNPDVSRLRALELNASVNQKRAALKDTARAYLNKMVIPDLRLPKNAEVVNPKPTPIADILDQFKKAAQMKLPQIAVPPVEQINLKDKLMIEIDKLKSPSVEISVPQRNSPDFEQKRNAFIEKLKTEMRKIAAAASKSITLESLGVLQVATGQVTFLNPYQCKQTAKGFNIPPVPPAVIAGIATIKGLSDVLVDSIDSGRFDQIIRKLSDQSKVSVTGSDIKALLVDQIDRAMPDVRVPNPSKSSIKDLLTSGSLSIAAIQLPSIPDPTKPPQVRIVVPGKIVKTAITESVIQTLDAFDVATIDFATISSIDAKRIIIELVEGNFKVLDATVGPFLNIISKYQSAKNKKFSELLGLPKLNKQDDVVESIDVNALERAKAVLKKIELVPYPAVAVAPQIFRNLHPILVADDLPPWERLTVKNFLFIVFLNSWCEQGKKGGGFFENP